MLVGAAYTLAAALGCGRILNDEAGAFPPVPTLRAQCAGQVQQAAFAIQQALRQYAVARAKEQCFHRAPSAIHHSAQRISVAAQAIDPSHANMREHKHRLLIAVPEGGETAKTARQFEGCAGWSDNRLDIQMGARGQVQDMAQALAYESVQFLCPVWCKAEAGRHGVTAAGQEKTGLARRDNSGPQVCPADGPPASFDDAVDQSADAAWPVEAFLQPPGNDADNTGMPVTRDEKHRMAGRHLRSGSVQGGVEHTRFDMLPLAVSGIQTFGQATGHESVIAQ